MTLKTYPLKNYTASIDTLNQTPKSSPGIRIRQIIHRSRNSVLKFVARRHNHRTISLPHML